MAKPATITSKRTRAARPSRAKGRKVKLTPEQLARLAAFRAIVKFQREQWARMTPKQKREAERKWELFKASINADRAGYRQVFVDD